jgi:hypothetical protein
MYVYYNISAIFVKGLYSTGPIMQSKIGGSLPGICQATPSF